MAQYAIADVERQLRHAASLDIGDWMRFEVGPSVNVRAAGAQGARIKVQSFIGTRIWAAFQVDLVADGIQMTGEPDTSEQVVRRVLRALRQAGWTPSATESA